jgi:hypothetical protein
VVKAAGTIKKLKESRVGLVTPKVKIGILKVVKIRTEAEIVVGTVVVGQEVHRVVWHVTIEMYTWPCTKSNARSKWSVRKREDALDAPVVSKFGD